MPLTREYILAALQSALLGTEYTHIIAIVYKLDSENKTFTLRYYFDREPTEDDYENAAVATTEVISHFHADEITTISEECIYTLQPIEELDMLDGPVYIKS